MTVIWYEKGAAEGKEGRSGRTISENAAANPYHCALYCFRPADFVRGSLNVASSVQRANFLSVGLPANNCFVLSDFRHEQETKMIFLEMLMKRGISKMEWSW